MLARLLSIVHKNGRRCQSCGRLRDEPRWVVDHIVPRSQGGTDDIANLRIVGRR